MTQIAQALGSSSAIPPATLVVPFAARSNKENRAAIHIRRDRNMRPPAVPPSAPVDPNEGENDLMNLTELHSSAEEPGAPEAEGELAELQSWDEPVDERGHRVGADPGLDPSIGEDLVQQGIDEADAEVRREARNIPDAP
jgi:hypothetical protein